MGTQKKGRVLFFLNSFFLLISYQNDKFLLLLPDSLENLLDDPAAVHLDSQGLNVGKYLTMVIFKYWKLDQELFCYLQEQLTALLVRAMLQEFLYHIVAEYISHQGKRGWKQLLKQLS